MTKAANLNAELDGDVATALTQMYLAAKTAGHEPRNYDAPPAADSWEVSTANVVCIVLNSVHHITFEQEIVAMRLRQMVDEVMFLTDCSEEDARDYLAAEAVAASMAQQYAIGMKAIHAASGTDLPYMVLPEVVRVVSVCGLIALANGDTDASQLVHQHVIGLTNAASSAIVATRGQGTFTVVGENRVGLITLIEWTIGAIQTQRYTVSLDGNSMLDLIPMMQDVVGVLRD